MGREILVRQAGKSVHKYPEFPIPALDMTKEELSAFRERHKIQFNGRVITGEGGVLRDDLEVFKRTRGVTTPCEKCHGAGVVEYETTAGWRGDTGVKKKTFDVCSVCWGTGDGVMRGVNLQDLAGRCLSGKDLTKHDVEFVSELKAAFEVWQHQSPESMSYQDLGVAYLALGWVGRSFSFTQQIIGDYFEGGG